VNPKNIFTELKPRNVYRAAVAYGVVAWFRTQLTMQVFPFFKFLIPRCVFVIALAVGFPIRIAISSLSDQSFAGFQLEAENLTFLQCIRSPIIDRDAKLYPTHRRIFDATFGLSLP
jgi:hypothetical protein